MTSFHVIAAPSIILIVAILFGNSLVIASYKINRRLKTRTNAFLVSLAVSDFLVGSISLPMCIYGITSEPWNVSIAFKAVFKSFDVFAALASIFHLTAISMERYIAVSRPFYYKRFPSLFQRVLITTAWSAACFLALLSNFTLLENSWSSQCYSLVLFICGLVAPTTIIARMYIGVFSVARSLQQRNPSHTTTKQSDGSLKRYYQGEKSRHHRCAHNSLIHRCMAAILHCVSHSCFLPPLPFFFPRLPLQNHRHSEECALHEQRRQPNRVCAP